MTDHKKALAANYRKAGAAATESYKLKNPDAAVLKLRADVSAYKPRPKSMRNHAIRAVRLFIGDPQYLAMTNTQMARHLSANEPGYNAPSNILTELFTPIEKGQVAALLRDKGIKLNISELRSPSALKLALRAYRHTERAEARVQVEVIFTEVAVIVNGKAHPIAGKAPLQRVRVGERKLNLDALRDLLGE